MLGKKRTLPLVNGPRNYLPTTSEEKPQPSSINPSE